MAKPTIINTTLGDLIVALTEETTPLIRSELETYSVVALILTHLLGKRNTPSRAWEY
jgi:hypothetical protein